MCLKEIAALAFRTPASISTRQRPHGYQGRDLEPAPATCRGAYSPNRFCAPWMDPGQERPSTTAISRSQSGLPGSFATAEAPAASASKIRMERWRPRVLKSARGYMP